MFADQVCKCERAGTHSWEVRVGGVLWRRVVRAGGALQLRRLWQCLLRRGEVLRGRDVRHDGRWLQVLYGELAGQQHIVELHDAVLDDGELAGNAVDLRLGAALEVAQVLAQLGQPRLLHHRAHRAAHLRSSLAQIVLCTRHMDQSASVRPPTVTRFFSDCTVCAETVQQGCCADSRCHCDVHVSASNPRLRPDNL